MPSDDNSGEKDFWTDRAGPKWVDNQRDLDAVMAGVKTLLISAASARAGDLVLDVGCGTGDTTLDFARIVGGRGRITGADVSETMLSRARERQGETGLANIDFLLADAQDHEFAPEAFDLIVSRFGVMFFADPVAAFRNMATALKPGGGMHFAAWAGPEHNPFFTLPHAVAVARLGPAEPVPPDAPGPMAFRDIARVTGMLAQAGLSGAEGRMVQTDLHHPGTAEEVAALLVQVGSAGRVIIEKGGMAADVAAVRHDLAAALHRFETADGVRIPAGINMFSAVRG